MTFSNGAFGIDHPLITVRDLDGAAEKLEKIGFVMTPRGKHPWGTHNRLGLFPGGLVELMTVGEPELVGSNTVDHQLFGTLVQAFQSRHEGICMMALHSRDLDADVVTARANGVEVTGLIDFRRPVTLPDGTDDVAVVSLAMLVDRQHPQLSVFLCQQHKRGLVEVPAWRDHPNGAERFAGWILLDDGSGAALRRAEKLWKKKKSPERWSLETFSTAGGFVDIVDREGFSARFPNVAMKWAMMQRAPCAVGISVKVRSLEMAAAFCREVPDVHFMSDRILIPPSYVGDTVIELRE